MKLGLNNPSLRLPAALLGRYLAGDTIPDLVADYDIPEEQVRWGLELAVWREKVVKLNTLTDRQRDVLRDLKLFVHIERRP